MYYIGVGEYGYDKTNKQIIGWRLIVPFSMFSYLHEWTNQFAHGVCSICFQWIDQNICDLEFINKIGETGILDPDYNTCLPHLQVSVIHITQQCNNGQCISVISLYHNTVLLPWQLLLKVTFLLPCFYSLGTKCNLNIDYYQLQAEVYNVTCLIMERLMIQHIDSICCSDISNMIVLCNHNLTVK